MHKSFTGSSRRQRQVNLSGRPTNANPFNARAGPQSMTAKLLDERAERQYQQALESSVRTIQRLWRGRVCMVEAARLLREAYLSQERRNVSKPSAVSEPVAYSDAEEALLQLQRLLFFSDPRSPHDHLVIHYYCQRLRSTFNHDLDRLRSTDGFERALLRLQNKIIAFINYQCSYDGFKSSPKKYHPYRHVSSLASDLIFVSKIILTQTVENGEAYYQCAADILSFMAILESDALSDWHRLAMAPHGRPLQNILVDIVVLPLSHVSEEHAATAYQWLTRRFLLRPELTDNISFGSETKTAVIPQSWLSKAFTDPRTMDRQGFINTLAKSVEYPNLAAALNSLLVLENPRSSGFGDSDASFRILGLLIYIKSQSDSTRNGSIKGGLGDYSSDRDFIHVVSQLLASIIDHRNSHSDPSTGEYTPEEPLRLSFLSSQVQLLVNEISLRNLISNAQTTSNVKHQPSTSDAILYANYALTLLRYFQSEADQMRMWLFLGPSTFTNDKGPEKSAIRYFWNAAKGTETFGSIRDDSRSTRYIVLDTNYFDQSHQIPPSAEGDWRVIFMFLELYTFVLKVMNDDEFFSVGSIDAGTSASRISHTRASALPLPEVGDLVTFLKHLGLSLYLDVTRLEAQSQQSSGSRSIADLFRVPQSMSRAEALRQQGPMGPTGASLTYMRTLITGLLRMIYERDSRKPFLPKGHWLMNNRFSTLFSTEELFKTLIQIELLGPADGKADTLDEDAEMEDVPTGHHSMNSQDDSQRIIGTGRAQRIARHDNLRFEQNRAFGEKQQLFLKPRFGVMENMPYTIPFMKRVHLFREFVKADKVIRRYGHEEAEYWRAIVHSRPNGLSILERQQGRIRRGKEMEDAFEQFYPIGDGLKEPIQIVFLDQFEEPEAGIDGGGVTKEFLTSLAKQIQKNDYLDMFAENEQRLLYPNPTTIDDVIETYSGDADQVNKALAYFEFVGRVVGKCLYEEILVDLNFAPFFVQKWSLCDENGAPLKESGFRATLDDLRFFDESLYRGLLTLKNHPGDVEAEYDVDFTIIDTATNLKTGKTRNLVKSLLPNGADMKVTAENRLLYVFATAMHRLVRQPGRQTNAFLRGLSSMIKPSWLRMFNQGEIQTLLSGTSAPVDLDDLRRNIAYSGVYQIGTDGMEHPTIVHFWQAMESLEESDKRAVLKFVTSTPRAPLLGFGTLNPLFTIRDSGRDEMRLPTASTCVNLLKLPMYSSFEVLREKLLYAVTSGAGFDLS